MELVRGRILHRAARPCPTPARKSLERVLRTRINRRMTSNHWVSMQTRLNGTGNVPAGAAQKRIGRRNRYKTLELNIGAMGTIATPDPACITPGPYGPRVHAVHVRQTRGREPAFCNCPVTVQGPTGRWCWTLSPVSPFPAFASSRSTPTLPTPRRDAPRLAGVPGRDYHRVHTPIVAVN